MQIIYIYNKNLEIVSQPWCKDLQTFNKNPFRYFKYWNDDCYASTVKFNRPIWDNGTVREMTREEICESGDLSVLNDGEFWEDNEIKVIAKPDGLKIEWIYPNWVETASSEEKKEKYYSLINEYKSEILDTGYTYVDTEEKEHQQKCRDKDLALLGNCISAHEDIATFSSEELKTTWAFNDGDILEMNLSELKKLRLQGAMFVQTVFNVEAILKGLDSNIKLTKNEFIELINENSNVKCWSY